jgi:hypothetical protein
MLPVTMLQSFKRMPVISVRIELLIVISGHSGRRSVWKALACLHRLLDPITSPEVLCAAVLGDVRITHEELKHAYALASTIVPRYWPEDLVQAALVVGDSMVAQAFSMPGQETMLRRGCGATLGMCCAVGCGRRVRRRRLVVRGAAKLICT